MNFEQLYSFKTFQTNMQKRNWPGDVKEKAIYVLLDSITAMIYGCWKQEVEHFIAKGKNSSTENRMISNVISYSLAMVNQELDEGNPIAKGHPACHFLPSIITVAAENGKSGKEFLESFVAGYELSARTGASITLKENIHPHGNWGMTGAAAALAFLYNQSANEMEKLFYLAAGMAYPTFWNSVLEGRRDRDTHIAMQNVNILYLTRLVESGYTGSKDTMPRLYDEILGNEWDYETFESILRKPTFLILNTYVKFYPYCRFCHAPIDLMNKAAIQVDVFGADRIDIYTYGLAARLKNQNVKNRFEEMFSIPYAMAKVFFEKESQSAKPYNDEVIRSFASRIFVHEDHEYTNTMRYSRKNRIEVKKDGRLIYSTSTDRATGDHDEPDLYRQVTDKCKRLLSERLSAVEVENIIRNIIEIENVPTMDKILVLIEHAAKKTNKGDKKYVGGRG